jgi:hypothetical protein
MEDRRRQRCEIDTALSAEAVREQVAKWAPWRMDIRFSNGFCTRGLETFDPLNPLMSLRSAATSLRAAGYLALETATYRHPDDPSVCRFFRRLGGDTSNDWAMNPIVRAQMLEIFGVSTCKIIREGQPQDYRHPRYDPHHGRRSEADLSGLGRLERPEREHVGKSGSPLCQAAPRPRVWKVRRSSRWSTS